MKKRIRFLLLVLCLCLSLLPAGARAEEAATSGTCGENAFWSFDEETGALTISGTGYTANYEPLSTPWEHYRESIRSVVLEEGITGIGDCAFVLSTELTKVSLPESLTYIGYSVFTFCEKLSAITIPQGVTTIADWAFQGCIKLEEITIPASMTSLGYGIFDNCSLLTGIWVHQDNPNYSSDDKGVLFNKDKTTLIQAPGSLGGDYAIPASVTALGDGAFSRCANLTGVTIPEGLSVIPGSAFRFCTGLTSVAIPSGVTEIGSYAFGNCTALTEITFTGDAPTFGENAFYEVTATAYYPDLNETWYSNEYIQDHGGTLNWVGVLPNSGTCGENALWSFDEETGTLTISGTGYTANYAGSSTPWEHYRESIRSVVVEEGVTGIGDCAFMLSTELTKVSLPESLTYIGYSVFTFCEKLSAITIPQGVTTIADGAFQGCIKLEEITIPASVTSLGYGVFDNCSLLTGIWVHQDNPNYSSDHKGVLFNKDKTTLIQAPGSLGGDYAIPASVTALGDGAFFRCANLTGVTIPEGLSVIPGSAFRFCTGLTSVAIPSGVTEIGSYAFGNCTALAEITFTGDAPTFGENAFYDVTATARYLAGNATWTSEVMQNYGGTITWQAYALIKNGIYEENGIWHYYVNNELQYGLGLILLDDGYYYIRSNGQAATGQYWVTNSNGLLPQGLYNFGADGKLILGKHGIMEENGGLYYYIGDHLQCGAGLIELDGEYYYIRSNGQVATGQYWVTNSNGLLPQGLYNFGTDGKLILGRHGIVEENGGLYYYLGDHLQCGAGLICLDGDYYYVRSNGQLATGKYWVTNTNGLMEQGFYTFGADGKMIP